MTLINAFKNTLKFIIDILFPIQCLGCNKEDIWLCNTCLDKLLKNLNQQTTCPICNQNNYFNGQVCLSCQKNFNLDKVFIALPYENQLIQKLIKVYKYNFIKDLSQLLSKILISYFNKFYQQEKLIVITSPLAKKRLRWRGFNQSELLAKNFAYFFKFTILTDLIIKVKNTKEQAFLNRNQRLENIKNVFQLNKKLVLKNEGIDQNISGQSFLIIDDVITTGATLGEIAKVLKISGAKNVWALVLAKN